MKPNGLSLGLPWQRDVQCFGVWFRSFEVYDPFAYVFSASRCAPFGICWETFLKSLVLNTPNPAHVPGASARSSGDGAGQPASVRRLDY